MVITLIHMPMYWDRMPYKLLLFVGLDVELVYNLYTLYTILCVK